MESGPVPPRRLVEPGRLTSSLLIASAAVLVIVELATQLGITVSDKANTALWVVHEAPSLALMAAFTGSVAAAAGAWWARLQQRASGTTMRSIAYGIGSAGIAAAVVGVLAWASIAQEVNGKVALTAFCAALLGGVFGSVRVGGAVLGGLVAVLVSMLISTAGLIGYSLSIADDTSSPAAPAVEVVAVTKAVAVAIGTLVGCWWLVRRRRSTPLPYLLLVSWFATILQVVALPIAWLAALPVAHDLPEGKFSEFWPQQSLLLVSSLGAGTAAALVFYTFHRIGRRVSTGKTPEPEPAPAL